MIPFTFPDISMVIAPKNTPTYLRYCKFWKLYISRKKWTVTRFHDLLAKTYGFKARDINRCFKLHSKQPSLKNSHKGAAKKMGQPGRKRKITKEQEDSLTKKYQTLHRTGWSGVIRQLNTDVCLFLFLFVLFFRPS